MTILAVAGAYTLARFADDAFARTLGHSTLRLGADPLSWLAIHTLGASPERDLSGFGKGIHNKPCIAASTTTSEYGIKLHDIKIVTDRLLPEWLNRVISSYVSKLMEYRLSQLFLKGVKKAYPILEKGPVFYLFKKILMHGTPFAQKMAANYARFSPIKSPLKAFGVTLLAIFASLITPTIKIRCPDAFEEPTNLIGRVVLVSEKSLSPLHIGLIGTLRHSLRLPPLFSHPTRMLKGVCQLALVGAVAYGAVTLCPAFIAAHQTAIVASAIFALI